MISNWGGLGGRADEGIGYSPLPRKFLKFLFINGGFWGHCWYFLRYLCRECMHAAARINARLFIDEGEFHSRSIMNVLVHYCN